MLHVYARLLAHGLSLILLVIMALLAAWRAL